MPPDVAKSFAPTTVAVLRRGSADGGLMSESASATAPVTAKAVVSYRVLVNSIGAACAPMAIDASSAIRNLIATVTPSPIIDESRSRSNDPARILFDAWASHSWARPQRGFRCGRCWKKRAAE